jgi:hypothetical protein
MKRLIAGLLIFWSALGFAAPLDPESPPELNQRVPTRFGALAAGATVVDKLPVEGGPTLFSVQWETGSVAVTLVSPTGQTMDADFVTNNPNIAFYEANTTSVIYYVFDAAPGEWQAQLTGAADIPDDGTTYRLFTLLESTLTMTAKTDRDWYAPGDQATVSASFSEEPATVTVTAEIAYSDGTTETIAFDAVGAQDFEALCPVRDISGYAQVSLSAEGTKDDGAPFARNQQWLFLVSPANAQFSGLYEDSAVSNPNVAGLYEALDVRVGIASNVSGTLGLAGDLVNANGEFVAHSTTAAAVSPGSHTLTLSFTAADIFSAKRHGPYRLTRLLLVDETESFRPLAEADDAYTTQVYNYRRFAPRRDYPSVQSGGPYTVEEGASVTLMATGADPEGEPLNYAWDLDEDGSFETYGQSVEYSAVGIDGPSPRMLAVKAVDPNGFSAVTQTPLDVLNVAPVVEAGADITVHAGNAFTSGGTVTDPGNDSWTGTVDYGDESGMQPLTLTGGGFELNHTYTLSGNYTVTVSVMDDDDGEGSDSFIVNVENQPPLARCKDVIVSANASCSGDANVDNGSADPDSDAFTLVQTPAGPYTLGTTEVMLRASDAYEAYSSCTATVTVVDDTPPAIICPADLTVECAETGGASRSHAAIAAFLAKIQVTDACSVGALTNDAPNFLSLGATSVTATAVDGSGNAASCTSRVTIEDTTPPVLGVSVNPNTLWPPNHKMVPITATVNVTDTCDANPLIRLLSITMNEGDTTNTYDANFDENVNDGNTMDDIQGAEFGTDDRVFSLRAERSGQEDGRVYASTYAVTDASGNENAKSATVIVPHNQ